MAFESGEPMILPSTALNFSGLSSRQTVAYAPTPGVPELRSAWRKQLIEKNPRLASVSFSQPMVVPGLTNGVFQTAELFVDEDDPVVIPDMFWGNYRLILAERRGARIVPFPFFNTDGGFNVDGFAGAVRGAAAPRGVRVLLNFPNNPTGYSPTTDEAHRIAEILTEIASEGTPLMVICDDAYFGLVYEDGVFARSMFELLADAHENLLAVKVDGATKEDFAWGFRIGFVTFASPGLNDDHYDAITKKLMGSIRSTVSNSSRIAQSVLLNSLSTDSYRREKAAKFELLESRYREVRRILDSSTDDGPLSPLPFNSGYFMSFIADEGVSTESIRLRLLESGIGTISIQDRYLRVAYASIDRGDLSALYSEIASAARSVAASG
jgi:aspartate/methionine/tyrosine aminotransferase